MKRDNTLKEETLKLDNGKIMVASDIHFPYEDKSAVTAFMKEVGLRKPDVIVLNGDLLDFYKLSKFSKDPTGKNPEEEIEMCKTFLKKLRKEAGKDCKIYYTIGNHSARLRKYILDNAPMVAGLMENVFSLLKLEESNTIGCASLLVNDCFLFKHGSRLGNKSGLSAIKELEAHYLSGASGHTHRLNRYSVRKAGRRFIWLETGCLCDLNPEYMIDPDWEQGFGIITFEKGKLKNAQVYPIVKGQVLYD